MKNVIESYKTTILGLIILGATVIYQMRAVKFNYETDSSIIIFTYLLSVGLVIAPDKVVSNIFAVLKKFTGANGRDKVE